MTDEQKTLQWLRLSMTPGLGPVTGGRLVAEFGSPAGVFKAGREGLTRVKGVGKAAVDGLKSSAPLEEAKKTMEKCAHMGVSVICPEDPSYPSLLSRIADPPLVLFVKGSLPDEEPPAVAMVGSRNPDPYGESMAAKIASGLARAGVTVVSGMARGIDGACQGAAMKAGGRSIAVLGTGVDVIYPPEHKELYNELCEKGAIFSEYPPGTRADAKNFPRRNRIVSGISLGVVMVQAMSEKSGALITVRQALDQDREVFAVPGNAGSRGGRVGNMLIKEGAKLVEEARDVLVHISPIGSVPLDTDEDEKQEALPLGLPDRESSVYALVPPPSEGEIDLDALARQLGLSVSETGQALLELELEGLIKSLPGKRYVRLSQS